MKNDIKIYICTHRDFINPMKSDNYEVIDARKINVNLPLDDKFYSEFYQIKYVIDNIEELPEYVGICHYRRYFKFGDNIPRLEKDKCLVTNPMVFKTTIREHYKACHNIEDLDMMTYILKKKYPEYSETADKVLNYNIFIPCNMFVMHRDKFREYCKFIFDIMDEYLKYVGTDIYKRIDLNKEKYLKNFSPNNTPEYQYRIGGYAGERLTNIFIRHNFDKIEYYDMVVTEDKYGLKN